METTDDGSFPPATVNDSEESSAHHHHHHHHHSSSSADVTVRGQPGCHCTHRESCSGDAGEGFPAGSGALHRCLRPGSGTPAELCPVTESTSPALCVQTPAACCGTELRRSAGAGGDGSPDGQTRSCCDSREASKRRWATSDPSDVTYVSDADRTVEVVKMEDGQSCSDTEGSEVSQHRGPQGGNRRSDSCCVRPEAQTCGKGADKLPNGRLVKGNSAAPPSSSSSSGGEGGASPHGQPQPEASAGSAHITQGTKPNREEEREGGEGLSCCPASGLLPVSMSCDSAPRGPGEEAFAEPQPGSRHFLDVCLGSRNTYESNRRQSAPGQLPQGGRGGEASEAEPDPEPALQSRRPGIVEYFGRGVFSRKQSSVSHSVAGWKLFGKVPPRESPTKNARTIQQESRALSLTCLTSDLLTSVEYEAQHGRTAAGSSPTQHAVGRSRKNLEFEPLSTTALILEDRPANLPAKSEAEAQRHRQQYDEMVAGARRRELKEAQRRHKQMQERFRQEESIASAMLIWNNDILPHWDSMKSSRRARELWWQGLPPNVRGRVWSLAIGNELNITAELYEIFLSRAKEKWRNLTEAEGKADDAESGLQLITLDISRTFPSLCVFQKGGPYHDLLQSILGAYTCYRPDVGYVQGMSFIAAVLILNLDEADAFVCFSNLINKPCQMAFFRVDHQLMLRYFGAFEVFLEESLPRLFLHFRSFSLTPDLYLLDWIFSLYTKPLPLDVACRVWDVFCRDGEEFLFRTGLGILRLYQDVLLHMDFIHIAQFLSRLPDEELLSDRLFACIAATPMLSGNRKWSQVLSSVMKEADRS